MTVPETLISPTLASLYAKQGHPGTAIAVLEALKQRQNQRKSEILTELLTRVTIHRTGLRNGRSNAPAASERGKDGIQREPDRDL
jgi:hypothetical protein